MKFKHGILKNQYNVTTILAPPIMCFYLFILFYLVIPYKTNYDVYKCLGVYQVEKLERILKDMEDMALECTSCVMRFPNFITHERT
jgi:hypothetical protein